MNKPWSTINDDELKLLRQLEEQVKRGLLIGMSFHKLRDIMHQLEQARK